MAFVEEPLQLWQVSNKYIKIIKQFLLIVVTTIHCLISITTSNRKYKKYKKN